MKWGSITQMICPMCGTLESVNTEQATVTPTAESCVTSEPYACGDCRIGTDKNRIGSSCRMCRNASPIFKKPPHRSKPPPMTKKSKTKTVKLSPGFVRYHHPVAVGLLNTKNILCVIRGPHQSSAKVLDGTVHGEH